MTEVERKALDKPLSVIARSEATDAIHSSRAALDCFAEPVIVRATLWLAMTTKEKGRLVSQAAFPFLRQLHIDRRFQNFCTRGLSPSRVLLGSRCQSGQSRTGARTDAMVSHLRKMTNQASIAVRTQGTAKHISPLFTDALS